jgi:hypothetical protein
LCAGESVEEKMILAKNAGYRGVEIPTFETIEEAVKSFFSWGLSGSDLYNGH